MEYAGLSGITASLAMIISAWLTLCGMQAAVIDAMNAKPKAGRIKFKYNYVY